MPADEAARRIVAAVQARRPRLLITKEARGADWLVRLTPTRWWSIAQRLAKRKDLPHP
jgi:hypothetical protein